MRSLHLPKKIHRKGTSKLVHGPVMTNAGQQATVTVLVTPRHTTKRPSYRVLTTGKQVTEVRLSGRSAEVVAVTISAPAAPGYTAFSYTRTYRTKK